MCLLQSRTTMLCRQVGPAGADCNRPAGDAEAGRELHISSYPDGARRLQLLHISRSAHLLCSTASTPTPLWSFDLFSECVIYTAQVESGSLLHAVVSAALCVIPWSVSCDGRR